MNITDFFKKNFTWDNRGFLLLLISVIPAIVISILYQPQTGLACFIGMIPAVFGGVRPKRKERVYILLLGVIFPVSLFLGTLLKTYLNIWMVAIAMALLGIMAVWLNTRFKWAPITLGMIIPIIGIGLSYSDFKTPLMIFVVMAAGSITAFIVALFFPEREEPPAPETKLLPKKVAKIYGLLYGAALAAASLLGFNLDHTGWIVGSTAFVMRPMPETEEFRSVWRMVSILVGITAVSIVMLLQPPGMVIVILSAVVTALAAGLHASRAYFMPAFMTYVVFSFLLYPLQSVTEIYYRYFERLSWVFIGIFVAAVFGLALPAIIRAIKKRGDKNVKDQKA